MTALRWHDEDGDGAAFSVASSGPIDLSIPLRFGGEQPACFGAPPASAEPLSAGGFVGDTAVGGSCNCQSLRLTPHGNGTHTECVGHVTAPAVPLSRLAPAALVPAALVTVEPGPVSAGEDHGLPETSTLDDPLISRLDLARAWRAAGAEVARARGGALVVRTWPNPPEKRWRRHEAAAPPPFFSTEAMQWVVERRFEHLLVDTPSVDRLDDGGDLACHRVFWGLPPGSRRVEQATRPTATITELIYVPEAAADGLYLLDLQVPPFVSDAAPSRPLLFALERR